MCLAEGNNRANGAEDVKPESSSSLKNIPTVPHHLRKLIISIRWFFGLIFTLNFLVFWALPVGLQGQAWKLGLQHVLRPIYDFFDQNRVLREIAVKYVYSKEVYTDFFVLSTGLALQTSCMFALVCWWQVKYDTVPMWLIYCYYFAWVGFGGRGMGGAYTLSHKEGHHRGGGMYKNWLGKSVGNFWENWMGLLYGNVPFNFSTSHIFLHHRLNAGKGDSFYQWDLNRASWSDFMFYVHRVFIYMTGWSSLQVFALLGKDNQVMRNNYTMLRNGMIKFWILWPIVLSGALAYAGCSSWGIARFLFFFFIEPLGAMAFFLAFINFGLHGFIEFDSAGKHIGCINSSVIMDGEDDYWGEDDHMAHHYYTQVTHRDLKAHQDSQKEEWKQYVGSCFKKLSIVELALFVLMKWWDRLAELHFVDYSGKLSQKEVEALLKVRAERIEMTYEEYEFEFLPTLTTRAESLVSEGKFSTIEQAYKYIAHSNYPFVEPETSKKVK